MTNSIRTATDRTRSQNNDTWQAQKSQNTRDAIMEAAIECFIRYGYGATTTGLICQHANMSRGAMMHHFKSRDAVISSALQYLHEKRLTEYRELIEPIAESVQHKKQATREDMKKTVDMCWRFVQLPSFTAFHELSIAARTDRKLLRTMIPMQREFEHRLATTIDSFFPYFKEMEETRNIISDVVFFSLQGMATSYMYKHKKQRIRRLLDALSRFAENEYLEAMEKLPS